MAEFDMSSCLLVLVNEHTHTIASLKASIFSVKAAKNGSKIENKHTIFLLTLLESGGVNPFPLSYIPLLIYFPRLTLLHRLELINATHIPSVLDLRFAVNLKASLVRALDGSRGIVVLVTLG